MSELCALNKEDVQLGEFPTLIVRAGKGRKRRYIPLGEVGADVVQDWLDLHNSIEVADQEAMIISLDHRPEDLDSQLAELAMSSISI